MVFLNCALSPIIKKEKDISAPINAVVHRMPDFMSACLKAAIPFRSGKKRSAIKPIAAPMPCILEASVFNSFFSFTLNIPDKTPAPKAKILIDKNSKIASVKETFLNSK